MEFDLKTEHSASELDCLLKDLLTEDVLNTQIQNTKCLKSLNLLLEIKQTRIINKKSDKLAFPIQHIYYHTGENDIEFKCNVLKKALLIIEQPDDTHIEELVNYLNNQMVVLDKTDNNLYEIFKLFNTLIDYCIIDNKKTIFVQTLDANLFNNLILSVLGSSSKVLNVFVIVDIIPKCLNFKLLKTHKLLENIFDFINKSNKLDILCSLYNFMITSELNIDEYNLLKIDEFWMLLENCLSSRNGYMVKQASYILAKSIDTFFHVTANKNLLSKFIKVDNITGDEIKLIWKNFLILLDVSNEKQLHLIQPSLPLLNSVKYLHPLWQICLYKILLNHSQNVVVYSVAINLLQFIKYDADTFPKIIKCLLIAINRNEYSAISNKMFEELKNFCTKMTNNEYTILLQESLCLAWNPTAVWCFYKNIFNCNLKFPITFSLFENLINQMKTIPNVYIREGSINIFLNYFLSIYCIDSLNELFKLSQILLEVNDGVVFVNFIRNNDKKITELSREMNNKLREVFVTKEIDFKFLEIYIRIHKLLEIDLTTLLSQKNQKPSVLMDFMFASLPEKFNCNDVGSYIKNRFDNINANDDFSYFVSLIDKLDNNFITSKLLGKAVNILKNYLAYNKAQIITAFILINKYGSKEDFKCVIDKWKFQFMKITGKIDEEIALVFMDLYFRHYNNNSTNVCDHKFEEILTIFENILDSQSHKVMRKMLENLSLIINNSITNNIAILFDFINNCITEILKLKKSSLFKQILHIFIEQLYQAQFLDKIEFSKKLLQLTEKLLDLSNNFTFIAYILSEKLSILTSQNPEKSTDFIPVIVDLILHGIVVRKDERTEYFIYQEISQQANVTRINPNLEEMLVRLKALDAMLNLINNKKLEFIADKFTSLLIEKYMTNFNKRYFPDSQIYLQKLRIIQALLLIHWHIREEKNNLVTLIVDSFLIESHQTSVKHIMQWLLICLLKNDINSSIQLIKDKIITANLTRASSVSAFISVLYNLVLDEGELHWSEVLEVFLPCTMGPQFKLRIIAQVAIIKLYEKAKERNYQQFLNRNEFLCNSIKSVIEASGEPFYETLDSQKDFLDYFNINNCDCSVIYYYISKVNKVTAIEWENLALFSNDNKNLINLNFKEVSKYVNDTTITHVTPPEDLLNNTDNVQKKISPWRDILEESIKPLNNFILITSLIEKSANLGGLSRTCEVFDVKKIVMRTAKVVADKEFKSLSMSSENWVDIIEVKVEDLKEFILNIKQKGYSVIGAEQTVESIKLDNYKFSQMTVLLLGNEKEGIPPNLIPLLDACVEIPQFGLVRSLNVHVAGAIFIWEYCKQHLT